MPLNPARYVKVFGSSFVKDYTEHAMLTIGTDTWTRADLAKLGVVQARSCSILQSIAKRLKVRNTKDLYASTSPYALAEFECGVVTMFVIFAIFGDKDLDVEAWYKAGKAQALSSFLTLKKHELDARARERADTKRRGRRERRDKHERNVKSFMNTAARL